MEARHDTVLLEEAVEYLDIQASDTVVDGTIGGAGHFSSLLSKIGTGGSLIGIDADHDAIVRAEEASRESTKKVFLVEDNFRNLGTILDGFGVSTISKSLFDLGWSGFHLSSGRGFSFKVNEPLLMTYGDPAKAELTAADIVNSFPEDELVDLLYSLGEERFARGIARGIVDARKRERILMTDELVKIIIDSTPDWYQHRRIHPATKTFQALRIKTNDELGALRDGLTTALERTEEGGRIAVITFHSLEDRIVKSMFRDAQYEGKGSLVNRKPIVPSQAECVRNPRARSAKLRVFACGVFAESKRKSSHLLYA